MDISIPSREPLQMLAATKQTSALLLGQCADQETIGIEPTQTNLLAREEFASIEHLMYAQLRCAILVNRSFFLIV